MENLKRILCYGDSNTWGYSAGGGKRFPADVRWTGRLAKILGPEFVIIEEGQNGRTTVWDDPIEGDKNGLKYLPVCLESQMPLDMVVLMLGTNDLKTKFSLTPLDIAMGVERLIQTIKISNCGVTEEPPKIIVICPPVKDPQGYLKDLFIGGREKSLQLPEHYQMIAERNGCAFLNSNDFVELDTADGIHFTAEGHRKFAEAVAAKISALFA